MLLRILDDDVFAFADEFRALAADGRLTLHTTVTRDEGPAGAPTRMGRVDAALLRTALPAVDAVCLVCGPSGFVQAVTAFGVMMAMFLSPRRSPGVLWFMSVLFWAQAAWLVSAMRHECRQWWHRRRLSGSHRDG